MEKNRQKSHLAFYALGLLSVGFLIGLGYTAYAAPTSTLEKVSPIVSLASADREILIIQKLDALRNLVKSKCGN